MAYVFNEGTHRVLNRITSGLGAAAMFVSMVLVSSTSATAQTIPTDSEITSGESAAVQPVLVVGPSQDAAWRYVSGFLTSKHARKTTQPVTDAPDLTGDGGFGFAGKARAADVRILAHATLLGLYAGAVAQGDASRDIQAKLAASADAIYAPLSAEAKTAVGRFVKSLASGSFDGQLFAGVLRAAESGIAVGPQRAHGYLAVGLWAGLAPMAAGIDGDRSIYAGIAGPLAVLLREDAEFEGADVTIAKTIESMATVLNEEKPDAGALFKSARTLFQVTSDK